MSRSRVLVSCVHLQCTIDRYRDIFEENAIDIDLPRIEQQLDETELLKIIDRYDGVIAGDDAFTARVLDRASRLKIISKWGVGVDAIDRDAAQKRGIVVTNTPNVFGNEVADTAMGYIILLARSLHKMHESVLRGEWLKVRGRTLNGMSLGIIGLGDIGRSLATRAAAHGMTLKGFDVLASTQQTARAAGIETMLLDPLLRQSDFIALCCNLTSQNFHMLTHPQFAAMREGVFIVNTARGPLIDEAALVSALESGKVAGAALDVFENEPLPVTSKLRGFEQCIFGTHNSSNTIDAVLRVNEVAIKNLLQGLSREAR